MAPAQVVEHVVPYSRDGSQNDGDFNWPGRGLVTGPLLRLFATKIECAGFKVPAATECAVPAQAPECSVFATAGACDGQLVTGYSIPSGRGNPEIPGVGDSYKLWVVGDPAQGATYTITLTWFYGPDC